MKKTSIVQLYYYVMICHIFLLICGISGAVIMLIYSNEFINNAGIMFGILFVIGINSLFLVLILSSAKELITLLKDLKALKNNSYISITGKVIKFQRNIDPESGIQVNNKPVVMIIDSDEEIILNVNDKIKVGETYKFNYLKNCRIAEIVEKFN